VSEGVVRRSHVHCARGRQARCQRFFTDKVYCIWRKEMGAIYAARRVYFAPVKSVFREMTEVES